MRLERRYTPAFIPRALLITLHGFGDFRVNTLKPEGTDTSKLNHPDLVHVQSHRARIFRGTSVLSQDSQHFMHIPYILTPLSQEMTILLWPRSSRIVNVSSVAHQFGSMDFEDLQSARGYQPWKAYGQSKLANLLFTYELARRLPVSANTTVNALHPGIVNTELSRCGVKP